MNLEQLAEVAYNTYVSGRSNALAWNLLGVYSKAIWIKVVKETINQYEKSLKQVKVSR